jgi:ribosomal protein S30
MDEVRKAQIREQAKRKHPEPPLLKARRWYRCAGKVFKVVSVNDNAAYIQDKGSARPYAVSARSDAELITPQEAMRSEE